MYEQMMQLAREDNEAHTTVNCSPNKLNGVTINFKFIFTPTTLLSIYFV